MENNSKKVKLNIGTFFWIILFFAGIICIWKTQREVPIMMDDEWYSTVLSSDAPLHSLGDIVQAQVWHYHNWGGRTVAHTIAQLIFLYLSEPVADALNVALIVLLAWMINAVMRSGNRVGAMSSLQGDAAAVRQREFVFLTLTIGFLHGLNANWKMSMYWQTGACNYLYTTVIILAFLWMYLRTLDDGQKCMTGGAAADIVADATNGAATGLAADAVMEAERKSAVSTAALILVAPFLGLLCGWTNENMGPAVWVLTVAVMLLHKKEGRPVRVWMILGSVCCLIGSVLMILAPGNAVRSAEVASNSYGALWQIFLRMYGVCKGAWEYLFPVVLATAAVLFVNLCVLKNKLNQKEILVLAGAILSWGAMVLSPHYPDRASFGTMCFLLCLLLSQARAMMTALQNKAQTEPSIRKYELWLAGIGVFIWLRGMYFLGEFLAICWGWIR